MAAGVPARLTAAEGRRFGLTVGGAFLVLAGLAWWRGNVPVASGLGALGGVLALAGLAIPTRLGPVERGWMALAHAISKVTTPIVMGAMYLLVLAPIGALRRTFGGNPMVHQPGPRGYWHERSGAKRPDGMRRQF